MVKRIFPFLNRPHVEFALECASFVFFGLAFLQWVSHL